MTEWTELVSKVFKEKRATNKNYKFKNALVDAKKLYRKTTKTVDSMGPGLMKKAAKSLKKAMKKTRKHRRHRGGKEPNSETGKCEDGSDPVNGECPDSLLNTLSTSAANAANSFIQQENGPDGQQDRPDGQENGQDGQQDRPDVPENGPDGPDVPEKEQVEGGRRKKQQKKGKKSKRQQKKQ